MRFQAVRPFFSVASLATKSTKLNNPSASRNAGPILSVLQKVLDKTTPNLHLLEISSGTGQHSAAFAEHFPNITFHPSEFDATMMGSISAFAEGASNRNVLAPVLVDIAKDCSLWQPATFDYMLNINMIHITPFSCTQGLFRNAGKLLKPNGLLVTYGPYAVDGVLTPESNVSFDAMLKSRNPEWGVRDVADLKLLAGENGMQLTSVDEMPASNKVLVWQKC